MLRVERSGDALVASIDVPERRNALSRRLLTELQGVLEEPGASRAVVLTGSGGIFSAGADLADLTGTLDDLAYDECVQGVTAAIRRSRVPVLCAVDGGCIGAALDLAAACDARVATQDSWFALPAARLGLLYDPAALQRLHARVAPALLVRLLVLGERLSSDEAYAGGLLTHPPTSGAAVETAVALVAQAGEAVPEALDATRRLLAELDSGAVDLAGWERERRALLASPARQAALIAAKRRATGAHPPSDRPDTRD